MITVDERIIKIVRGLSEREREKLAAVGGAFLSAEHFVAVSERIGVLGTDQLAKVAKKVRIIKTP